ncbi:MAG: hypothetical protein J1G01_04540 [Clostridiales bacterium]|nr:hypothetical protein [Clostridiales bacterium]
MATYEIFIKNEAASEKSSPIAGGGSESKSASQSSGGVNIGIAKGLVAYNHYIKPFVSQMVNHHVSTVALRTGAEEHEERLSFAVSAVQKVGGLVSSVAMGAIIGNLPGAIIGGVLSIATTAMEYSNKQRQLDMQRTVENIGLRYMNARAGGSVASFSGSRMKAQ